MKQRIIIDDQEYDNASLDNKVAFIAEGHRYINVENPSRRYKSVTGLIKDYKEPFDADSKAQEVVSNPRSKYFGRDWEDVALEWKTIGTNAANQGTELHLYGELLLNGSKPAHTPSYTKAQYVPEVVKHLFDQGYTVAKTELLVYSDIINLAGQSDILLKKPTIPDYYAIYDWKFLSKPLKKNSYYNIREARSAKLAGPFKYLDDCNWMHYSIQTAIYQTLTGSPELVKEKVLIVVTDDGYKLEPCYPMRVFWDENDELQAVYEVGKAKWYDSRVNRLLKEKPADVVGL